MASDLIEYEHEPDENHITILKFFKVPTRGYNKLRAAWEAERILEDEANREAWINKPPTTEQKEYLQYWGIKAAECNTQREAGTFISKHKKTMQKENPEKFKEYEDFKLILDEFSDKENCEAYDINKPSKNLLNKTINDLLSSGTTLEDLEDEPEILVEALLKAKPDLAIEDD